MNRFLQHYTLSYTTLSPIHIGTGDSYEPTNYVIDDGTLYEFDTGGAMAACSDHDRDELNKIVNGHASEQMLKAVQTFFYSKREALKPWAINAIPVLDGVANYYQQRVGQTANREAGGKQVIAKLEIDRTAYNPVTRQPVLFGSSIKGAIRTALLDQVNQGNRASERKGLHEFQGRLLQYRDPEYGKITLEQDPMRLIQLGDAAWHAEHSLPTTQVYLAVNRKKVPVDNKGVLRQAMGENLYRILECIPAFYAHGFNGQMSIQHIELNAPGKLPAKSLRFSMADIAAACNRFYLPQLTTERKLLQERGYGDANWLKQVGDLLNLAQDKIKNGNAFLLRVGRHSGAEAVTVSGARNGNIKIMKGKGQQPEYADAPKTLWLAAETKDQRENLLPFGWLLVELHPGEGKPDDGPELAELCATQQGTARQWAEKQVRRQAEDLAKRQADEQRRQQEEVKRQQRLIREQAEAQAAEQARVAEQQRQAQLSPIELDIETFLTLIQPQDRDTRLLQELESGRWQDEDAKFVAAKVKTLMEQAGKWLPDFAGDNKQKVKLRERSRKVLSYLPG